ncbi:MAG: SulP family inorganic anion transporter [Chlamydiae bacterium]|nr:SulP family inorganic anion transporter [Chlamydiota bacterium]
MNTAYLKHLSTYCRHLLKYDFIAGIVVFLVAIPLCLGVALACGAPIYSGIVSGICGGVVVGIFSRSQLSVSGPSAAIIAVMISAISQLHHYPSILTAIFISGLLQVYMGTKKYGFFADYIPSSVIQGMLSAIGILLIIKQLPLAFSLSQNLANLDLLLIDSTEGLGVHPAINFSFTINPGPAILSSLALIILLSFDKTQKPWLKFIPMPIVVIILGTLINEWLILKESPYAQIGPNLVNLPQYENLKNAFQSLASPNWDELQNPKVYLFGLLIASVTSLESLLNVTATERLDPQHHSVDKNKELIAQGLGNICTSLFGGLPVSSAVVRSSINIQSQGKTKVSTIFHGILLLTSFFLIPAILNHIPLCILASLLIFTGYKITTPKIYFDIYQQGKSRFIPFIITIIGIIAVNLLFGILAGLLINCYYILKNNSTARIDIIQENHPSGVVNRLLLPQQTTFLNKASIVAELNTIPNESQLIIDARYTEYLDKEIIEYIKEFKEEVAPARQILLNLIGFKNEYAIHDSINFINVSTHDAQSQLTPMEVLSILKQGNQRFLKDQGFHRSNMIDIRYTSENQHPIAIVLGCIDSRVPVETVFDMTVGDLFCVRIAGNVINDDILASIEYGCNVVGAKLIVVLGHTGCGAIQAACNQVKKGHITQLLEKIQPAIEVEESLRLKDTRNMQSFIDKITHLNIANSMLNISRRSDILKNMLVDGTVGMIGALYDISTGIVTFSDYSQEIAAFTATDQQD